jgi:hypothetical protein
MKTIEAVSIWDNGTVQQATILNSYAVNVTLNTSATFWYGLFSANEDGSQGSQLAQGNVSMSGDDYAAWQEDTAAWDFIASTLGLTITGDYVAPVPVVEEAPTEEVVVEEAPAEEVIAE